MKQSIGHIKIENGRDCDDGTVKGNGFTASCKYCLRCRRSCGNRRKAFNTQAPLRNSAVHVGKLLKSIVSLVDGSSTSSISDILAIYHFLTLSRYNNYDV